MAAASRSRASSPNRRKIHFSFRTGAPVFMSRSTLTNPVVPGDVVQVIGFPVLGQYAPVLEDAIFRRRRPSGCRRRPHRSASTNCPAMIMTPCSCGCAGQLMNRVERADEQVLVLEAENLILNARLDTAKADRRFAGLAKRQRIRIDWRLPGPARGKLESLRSNTPRNPFNCCCAHADDVAVIRNPPWWTLSRLLWMLGMMSVVLLAGFAWVFVLDRQRPAANDHHSTENSARSRPGGTHPHRPRISRHARTGIGRHHHSTRNGRRPIRPIARASPARCSSWPAT